LAYKNDGQYCAKALLGWT